MPGSSVENMCDELEHLSPEQLAELLDVDAPAGEWRTDELASVLRHQLSTPLSCDLDGLIQIARDRGAEGEKVDVSKLGTFEELLLDPRPAASTLIAAKDFAKRDLCGADALLSRQVAFVLYYGCIAAAQVRLNTIISALAADELRRGYTWALTQDWLSPPLRELIAEGLAATDDPDDASLKS